MCFFSLLKMFWEECFIDLYLVGKIIVFPLLAAFAITIIPFAVFEFFLVDIWVIAVCALSKSITVGDCFDFWFG